MSSRECPRKKQRASVPELLKQLLGPLDPGLSIRLGMLIHGRYESEPGAEALLGVAAAVPAAAVARRLAAGRRVVVRAREAGAELAPLDARLAAAPSRDAEPASADPPMPIGNAPPTARPTVRVAPPTVRAATVAPAMPYTKPWRSTPRTRGENTAAVAPTASATSDSKKSSGI